MQPILSNTASYRKGKVGLPKKVIVSLYQDHIEIQGKEGEQILNAPLQQLTDVGKGFGFIAFKHGEDYYGLEFISMTAKLFNIVGMLLSQGRGIANQWKAELEKLGITVRKQAL